MIDVIKQAVSDHAASLEGSLSDRDLAGIGKIQFELDLLDKNHPPKKAKKSKKSDDSTD